MLQSKAVIETVDGVQRIRGLAGSGKTIVLALKAGGTAIRRDSLDAATAALGLTITPHLRDTAASLAIQAGASVVAVARLLGHEWAARHAGQFGGASGRRCGVPRLSMDLCVEFGSGWRCQRRTRRSPVGEVARIDRRGAPTHGTLGR